MYEEIEAETDSVVKLSRDRAYVYIKLGKIAIDFRELVKAKELFLKAIDLRVEVARQQESDETIYELASTLADLGDVAMELDNPMSAKEAYSNAMEVARSVAGYKPADNLLADLGKIVDELGFGSTGSE